MVLWILWRRNYVVHIMLWMCEEKVWAGWWQIKVEEDRERRDEAREGSWTMWVAWAQTPHRRKQECAHSLPEAWGGQRRRKHLCEEWKLWVISESRFNSVRVCVWKCVSVDVTVSGTSADNEDLEIQSCSGWEKWWCHFKWHTASA